MPTAIALVSVFAFAINDLFFRLLAGELGTWLIMGSTSLALFIVSWVILRARRQAVFPKKLWGLPALLLFFRIINTFFAISTFKYLTVSQAYLLIFTYPIIIVLAEALWYRHFRRRYVFSLLLAVVGLGLVFYSGSFASIAGIAFGLLTAVTIAGQIITARQMPNESPFQLASLYSAGALVVSIVGLSLFGGQTSAPLDVALVTHFWPLMGQVVSGVIGSLAYTIAAQKMSSARYGILGYLQIPIAVLLAWAFLREPITLRTTIGLILIISGSLLAQSKSLWKMNARRV